MKKLLITGFEPFGGEIINPSWQAVKQLSERINGYELCKLELPVVFGLAFEKVLAIANEINPSVILCIGQAGGRNAITPELVAINIRHATIPDNNGNQPKDEPIILGGDNAYFSTLPVRKMAEAIRAEDIPSQVSYSAGAYVCNDLFYSLLAHFKGSSTRVCFIHIPYCEEQNKQPSMPLTTIIKALTTAIGHIDD
jgi:pyroglutamyl-peptidase